VQPTKKIRITPKLFLPVAFLLVCFLWTSFYGLNFGAHWDENRAKFDAVKDSVRTGLFLQASSLAEEGSNYNHGGVNYLLTWLGLTPEVARYLIKGPRTRPVLFSVIAPIVDSVGVRVRVRAIYAVLSSLSIVWLFYLNLLLGRSRGEAFLGAAILAFSWEVAYHSRWIAPDVIMMQFGWLAFLCLLLGEKSKRLPWFYSGAVAIGLTIGTKYTGALLMPFFLVGAMYFLKQQGRSTGNVAKHGAGFLALAGFTFVLTTPGVVLDPFRFLNQLGEQHEIYTTGWYGYTVKPGIPHFFEILKYLSLQIFSHFWSISIVFAALCLIGIVALFLERNVFMILAAGFCLAYLLFFSQQAAMIVRNLLIVAPFLALAAARGITILAEDMGSRAKPVFYAGIGSLLAINLGWQIYAAREIKIRFHPEYFLKEFERYAARSPKDTFLVSSRLFNDLQKAQLLPSSVTTDPTRPYSKVVFLQTEGPDKMWQIWPSNAWGMYERTFGPQEVNLEAYSTFIGNERILVVTKETFLKLPVKDTDLLKP
jgi:hypothetical protein